jgi:predicted dehydrogenase
MKSVRIGMIGAGFVSRIHLNAFKCVTGVPVEFTAIASRGRVSAEKLGKEYGFKKIYNNYKELINDDEIDVVDICVPNSLHAEICIEAANAGKHIICEKPLTAAFGVNGTLDRERLYDEALDKASAILEAAKKNNVKICYAEDFIYSPAIVKAKRLLKQSKGAILEIRSEESHSGSHAQYSRRWEYAGGGSLLRLGSHPIGAVLHLKHYEGMLKYNKPINAKSVIADVAELTKTQHYKSSGDKWMVDQWVDVEDWGTLVITFEDGTKAVVMSNDTTLGGIVNTIDIYTSNCVIKCNMASNDTVKAYAPADEIFGDEYISEKIETKSGWTFPSPDEDWMRGYPQEMQDFVEAVAFGREPVSDGELGRQVVAVTYAAYLSAEEGRRIDVKYY